MAANQAHFVLPEDGTRDFLYSFISDALTPISDANICSRTENTVSIKLTIKELAASFLHNRELISGSLVNHKVSYMVNPNEVNEKNMAENIHIKPKYVECNLSSLLLLFIPIV
jgi:hypothetical protein